LGTAAVRLSTDRPKGVRVPQPAQSVRIRLVATDAPHGGGGCRGQEPVAAWKVAWQAFSNFAELRDQAGQRDFGGSQPGMAASPGSGSLVSAGGAGQQVQMDVLQVWLGSVLNRICPQKNQAEYRHLQPGATDYEMIELRSCSLIRSKWSPTTARTWFAGRCLPALLLGRRPGSACSLRRSAWRQWTRPTTLTTPGTRRRSHTTKSLMSQRARTWRRRWRRC
jgi:hypothetical protein